MVVQKFDLASEVGRCSKMSSKSGEKDPLLVPPGHFKNDHVQKSATGETNLKQTDIPVFRITSDEPEENQCENYGTVTHKIIIRDDLDTERKRICGSGRLITFAIIWLVLIICIIILGVYFRLESL